MYVKAREDLALGQDLQIQYNLKCSQCKYNQFPPIEDPIDPTVVAQAPKQQFVPLFIPSMKIFHKYCSVHISFCKLLDVGCYVLFEQYMFHVICFQVSVCH